MLSRTSEERYEFTRCGRCHAQLEPAPFGTPDNDEDWGHPVGGEECWPLDDPPAAPLFPVERVVLARHADGHLVEVCHRCNGEGEIHTNPSWPDPQTEDTVTCPECGGTGTPTSEGDS